MKKKLFALMLAAVMVGTTAVCASASGATETVSVTATKSGDYDHLEQVVLEGKTRGGDVTWTYSTDVMECLEKSHVYWYGLSGNLFVLNYRGSLIAFDAQTGTRLWETPEGIYSFCEGVFDNAGNLCMICQNGPIFVLNRDGAVLGKFNTDRLYYNLALSTRKIRDNRLTVCYASRIGNGGQPENFGGSNMPALEINLEPYQNTINVVANGRKLDFDVAPFVEQNRTFVPVRAIFEAMGAVVTWDNNTQTIIAQKGTTTVTLEVGKKEIRVNGVTSVLDVAPQVIHDRTMIPTRAVSESFGYSVGWDNETKTVTIEEASEQPPVEAENEDDFSDGTEG